jgi:hypothetical protein
VSISSEPPDFVDQVLADKAREAGRQRAIAPPAKRNGNPVPNESGRTIDMVSLDTIKSVAPKWVWEYGGKGRIQLGALTMFAGKPAAGKSTAARWFASRISRGELEGCWYGHPMKVAVMMLEEQDETVVVPGLEIAGADTSMIIKPKVTIQGVETALMSQRDEHGLTEMLVDNEIRALFIDPVMSTFSSDVDVYRNNSVRENLAPFTRIAEAINGVVIGIGHLKKGEVNDVLGSINGSSAFGEVPRCVFGFSPTGDGGAHILEQVKNSAGLSGLKLAYTLPVETRTTSDGQPIEMVRFNITGKSELSITDVSGDEITGIAVACEWLEKYLSTKGPTPSRTVKNDARDQGDINDRTLTRAVKRLGVVVKVQPMPKKPYTTVWCLPDQEV